MNIVSVSLGQLETNCYIVSSSKNNVAVIDPAYAPEKIISLIDRKNLIPQKILLTHGHFDHIMAAAELAEKYNIPVYIHALDKPMLKDTQRNLLDIFRIYEEDFHPILNPVTFEDGSEINLDELSFKALHTPGHTHGSCCFICKDVIFSGDTVFAGSIGRTDSPDSSMNEMLKSLEKISSLDGDYKIFPGHGPETSLSRELEQNIYLSGIDLF